MICALVTVVPCTLRWLLPLLVREATLYPTSEMGYDTLTTVQVQHARWLTDSHDVMPMSKGPKGRVGLVCNKCGWPPDGNTHELQKSLFYTFVCLFGQAQDASADFLLLFDAFAIHAIVSQRCVTRAQTLVVADGHEALFASEGVERFKNVCFRVGNTGSAEFVGSAQVFERDEVRLKTETGIIAHEMPTDCDLLK